MTLNAFAAQQRLLIFQELVDGATPSQGDFDEHKLTEGRTKGDPQVGATRYEPHHIVFEFVYPDPTSSATVFTVRIESPEPIVFWPVPSWVVENSGQVEIDGSFHFESDARRLIAELESGLEPGANKIWFQKRAATRRE